MERSHVAVVGLGYVGSVSAACLAELGHRVIGIDTDAYKVECINAGQAPFFEPGLESLLRKNITAGRLSATTSIAGAMAADIALICVGTPSERNGNLSLTALRRVSEELARELIAHPKAFTIAIRSTVFPGTCEEVVIPAVEGLSDVSVVANPEFLREGSAVRDFMEPSLLVVGGCTDAGVRQVAALYEGLPVEPCLVSLRTAEMIKYACNAFHAAKIVFANEIAALAESLGVDGEEVMQTVCRDQRLNISPAYLKPGFAFGGSCLPKDLRALTYRAARLDVKLPTLGSILLSNEEHLRRAIRRVLDCPAERVGIYGLTFKENTDDLRESPAVGLIEHLIGKGREVRIYDPHIQLDQIYGANRNFLLSAIPHIGKLLTASFDDLLSWTGCLVFTQKPAPEVLRRVSSATVPILHLWRAAH